MLWQRNYNVNYMLYVSICTCVPIEFNQTGLIHLGNP